MVEIYGSAVIFNMCSVTFSIVLAIFVVDEIYTYSDTCLNKL